MAAAPAVTRTTRILSLDVLRGLDVLLMLFVNEMAGVHGTPAWLLHTPPPNDGMTITDVVFPAFLFITGMSIPLALGARMARGEPRPAIWRHVLVRSISLIVLGVFMVNAEHGAVAGVFSPDLWNVLVTLAVFLVWQTPAPDQRRWPATRVAGMAALVALAFLYRSAGATGLIQIRPHWWGILGLIGWAYLVAASVYLVVGGDDRRLLPVVFVLYGLYFLDQSGVMPWLVAFRDVISIGEVLGSHAALVLTGTCVTAAYLRNRELADAHRWWAILAGLFFGCWLIALGSWAHLYKDVSHVFWISKVMATPAWCLISSGLTVIAWEVLLAVERLGWHRWPPAVTIAGEQALLIYLIAPLVASLLALSAPLAGGRNLYADLGDNLLWGTVRSIVFAWVVVRLAGWLRLRGLRLRL